MAAPTIINWERINARLPYLRTPEHRALRRRMWAEIDCNDNGFVSLAEVTRVSGDLTEVEMYCDLTRPNCCQGVRDVINVDVLFECRPAINAAFHHCKSISKVNLNILMLIICSTVVKF